MKESLYIMPIVIVALLGPTHPAQAQACVFDAQGRLTLVRYSSTQTVAYAYDAAGNITNQVVTGILAEPDADSDTLPDAWEWVWLNNLTNTAAGDNNQDTISNVEHFQEGTDPADPDTDRDGVPNIEELVAGTVPTNGQDYFRFDHIQRVAGNTAVDVLTHTGRLYDIDVSTSLQSGVSWSPVTSGLAGTEGALSVTNAFSPGAQFYRVRVRKP